MRVDSVYDDPCHAKAVVLALLEQWTDEYDVTMKVVPLFHKVVRKLKFTIVATSGKVFSLTLRNSAMLDCTA